MSIFKFLAKMMGFDLISCRGGHQCHHELNSDTNIQAHPLLIKCELLGPGFVINPRIYQTLTKNQYVSNSFENTRKEGKW